MGNTQTPLVRPILGAALFVMLSSNTTPVVRADSSLAESGHRTRRAEASAGWSLSEQQVVIDTSRDEPLSEFVWNDAIYQATLKAKEFGE